MSAPISLLKGTVYEVPGRFDRRLLLPVAVVGSEACYKGHSQQEQQESVAMAIIRSHRGLAPSIHPDAFVAETAVIIGDVEIGAGSSIWYGCVLRGDSNRIRIGRNTNVQDGTIIHSNHDPEGDYRVTGGGMPCLIGDDVTIGHLALLHACTVEDGAFIGMRSVVMDLAVVEGGAMVAAGAVVTPRKRVAKGELWAGNPARHLRDLRPEELEGFPQSVATYLELAESYRRE
ncbi:MAG TPA: gamma carbonic anhydrase family protein [Kiloniellales bacterium]|nr:gamma carbonic anhydrase family protein [Kiloniellales bacterium]